MNKILLAGVATAVLVAPQTWALGSVKDRMMNQEAYRPLPIRAGGFLVAPKVDVEGTYDDNIYATDNNTESDFITTVRPSVEVQSNWNRHAVGAKAVIEHNRYADNDDENTTNHFVGVDGKLDIMAGTAIGGGVSIERQHEDRGDPNRVISAQEPTEVDIATAQAGIYRELGRVNARFDSKAQKKDYKNGTTTAGALIDNNLRDRNEYTQTVRVGYKATPSNEIFVRANQNTRVYDRKGGVTPLRSSHGTSVVVGSAFDITGKTAGEVFVGAMERDYVNPALKDIDTKATWGGNVLWNATDLTSVKAGVVREIEETTLGGSSAYVATTYDAKVEHALRRNVIVDAGVAYTENDYEGNAAQREDTIWGAGTGVSYLFNRCLKGRLGYAYTQRDSNVAGGDYDRNRVMLSLNASF